MKAIQWMIANGESPQKWGKTQFDGIDLNDGRDFLAEDRQYDIVVLHFVFRDAHRVAKEWAEAPELRVSPRASWEAWRRRLSASGARLIVGMGEVGGGYIVTLDGYESVKVEDEFWVFRKKATTPEARHAKLVEQLPFEHHGYLEEVQEMETNRYLGTRKIELPDRECGAAGEIEHEFTEPFTLRKGFKDVTYKASKEKPVRAWLRVQIMCGPVKRKAVAS
jgi:hypothetical protein